MIEPIVVDAPVHFPMACSCGNQHGPLIDTHRERAGLHEYVCLNCAKDYARLFGFLPGDKLNELAEAAAAVVEVERENEKLLVQLATERDEAAILQRSYDAAIEKLEKAEGRIEQLETRREQIARELVA